MKEITLNPQSEKPLKRQLYDILVAQIRSGHLCAGEALPSTRALATALKVARSTVTEAYEMLLSEGYTVSRQGAPTRVESGLCMDAPQLTPMLTASAKPSAPFTSFQTGRPDVRQFPRGVWQTLLYQAANTLPVEEFGYGGPQGLHELRVEIAQWLLRSRGIETQPEAIMITSGATHALHLLGSLLCDREGAILMEDPCNTAMFQALAHSGATLLPVRVDTSGLQTQALPSDAPVRAVYVTPSHQFPLGGILPAQRRAVLIHYARERCCYIIEDDYDSEFRYSGAPIAPIQTLDPEHVIYVGTFSKSLFPSLRIGFVVLPYTLRDAWGALRTYTDVQNPPFEQAALTLFLRSRRMDRHVQRMRRLYTQRRKALLDALTTTFGKGWEVFGDAAGLHATVRFPGKRFDSAFEQACVSAGLRVSPLETYCIRKGRFEDCLLIGYGHLEPPEILTGITLLAAILNSLPSDSTVR